MRTRRSGRGGRSFGNASTRGEGHAGLADPRELHVDPLLRARLAHDVERNHGGDGVANAGNKPDDGVEAEPDIGARKDKRGVEQIGERIQPRDTLGARLSAREIELRICG